MSAGTATAQAEPVTAANPDPSRAVEVAFLGPEGTFASQAVRRLSLLPTSKPVPLPSVHAVIDAVEAGTFRYGVVPLENSVEGVVTPTLDRLVFHTQRVLAAEEVVLPVTFTAFTLPAWREHPGPWEVISHPHALAQCQQFCAAHATRTATAPSTAAACAQVAAYAADDLAGVPDVAPKLALASPQAGQAHALAPVAEHVEDHHGAATRFLLLAHGVAPDDAPCNTLMVVTPPSDQAGILAGLLAVVARHQLNLSSLVVRPLKRSLDRYTFVLTVRSAISDPNLQSCLNVLVHDGHAIKLLGSYRRDPHWNQADSLAVDADFPLGSVHGGASRPEGAWNPPVITT